jgi:hypothetical protein
LALLNGKSLIFKIKVKSQKSKKALGILPKGILTPSFIEIAPAVTKRALPTPTDDDDRRHVIHVIAKNNYYY